MTKIQNWDKLIDDNNIGNEMYELIKELFPICRSITGNGVRKTLKIIAKHIPLEIHEVKTGTKVFDWVIPKEWNINDAYIKNSKGEKIVDFKKSNLHVMGYSVPIHKKVSLNELRNHLYTLPDLPNSIPYRTSYYEENWGFCLKNSQYENLEDDVYEVVIDSTLENGSLSYGEYFLQGELKDEILLSCYICHPSMCNDNLSGISLLTVLAKMLHEKKLRYSYRFLFIPETIGAITWLCLNKNKVSKIKQGLVATCLGDSGKTTYKKTKHGDAEIDKVVEKVLIESNKPFEIKDFSPIGSDERQFSSPGFNLPIGSLMRSPYLYFPEYHTSNDNLDFVDPIYLYDSFRKYAKTIFILENNLTYLNLYPNGEPQLGKRGLQKTIGANQLKDSDLVPILWILNLSDDSNSLLDISSRSQINFESIKKAADILIKKGLLRVIKR